MHGAHKMAAFSRVALLLICWIQHCSAQEAPPSTLTITPSTMQLTPNTTSTGITVTVTCGPPSAAGNANLFALSIRRQLLDSQTSTLVTKASSSNANDKPQPQNPFTGATASGSLGERIIRLVMTEAKCNDQGTYSCVALYDTADGTPRATSEDVLKAEVRPGQLTLTVTQDKRQWKVNETLTMSCNGAVGSVNTTGGTSNPQIKWHWEYKRSDGLSWTPYDGPDGDINTGGFGTRSCYKTQTSTLTRRLSFRDSGSVYRCYIQRGNQQYTEYADEYSVGSVTADGTIPVTDGTPQASSANVGAIVGGVFGALIVIAVIIIIIYFLVIRPRRRKQAEENMDGGPEKGGDNEVVPPYTETADPAVVYSQPRRAKDKNKQSPHSGHHAGRWNDRDRDTDRDQGGRHGEGLHYADLDLMRNPPRGEPAENSRGQTTPTEYAAIRLY